ncbi:MAG: amino acid ABC transporter permease [Solirubrobacteraceae bacterium]
MDGRPVGRARAAIDATLPQPGERRLARAAAKARRNRRQLAVSVVSTVVVLGLLVTVVVTSEGWPTVRETFFNPTDFKDSFPAVLRGFWLDVKLFVIVEIAVLILGLVVALARISRTPALFPVRLLSAVFVDVLRGVPTILVVYLIGFGVPALMLSGLPTDPVVLGGIALTLAYSAYVGEVYRAGIESVHPSQRAAALAVGLTEGQATRHVVLPQAVRSVAPPLLNDFISLQKDVALISILGPLEAFRVAQIEASSNFVYTPLVAAALLYLCVTVPLARILDRWERRRRR